MDQCLSDISAFFNPFLCANNSQVIKGTLQVCPNEANNACGKCNLVQYCSKVCQLSDWKHHKVTCKSELLKDAWQPAWFREGRQPAFIGDAPQVSFGTNKYLWGNMPAMDILCLNDGASEIKRRELCLLFAASGDLRNVLTTIAHIPDTFVGTLRVTINDKDFTIVARNIIMLLTALIFDIKIAVPMIVHLWYSAALPRVMVDALQSKVLPMIQDVCNKIQHKSVDSMQAKEFAFDVTRLRVVLRREEWFRLARFFTLSDTVTLEKSHQIRRRITLAPERIDYRERSMLQWPLPLRVVDMRFREKGVLLPYGCSVAAFDTPNPTFFQEREWPMRDSSHPREGWPYHKYKSHATIAKADEHGALFFYVRDILSNFCARLRKGPMSFQMFCMDAQYTGSYLQDIKFDRIEISNICDRGFLGPHLSVQIFSPLLKLKTENPEATLIMLFLNAASEMAHINKGSAQWKSDLERAMSRLNKYMPLDRARLGQIRSASDLGRHPYFVNRTSCHDMLRDWEHWFGSFLDHSEFALFLNVFGLKMRKKHLIAQPWPCKITARTSKDEIDVLRASSLVGYERYIELTRQGSENEE